MSGTQKPPVTIIGAGLTGCYMAILLARCGYAVTMYERNSPEEIVKGQSKRAFNLLFRSYGKRMLQEIGLWDVLEPHTLSLRAFKTQVTRFSDPIETPVPDVNPSYVIKREDLLSAFLNEVGAHPNIEVHFNTSVVHVHSAEKTITVQNEKTQAVDTLPFTAILGADGVHSVIRAEIQNNSAEQSVEYSSWGYKQIVLTKEDCKHVGLEKGIAYTWSRRDAVIVSHPNKDDSTIAVVLLPRDEKSGFSSLTTPSVIQKFLEERFPILLPALPRITEALLQNPEGRFTTVHASRWHKENFMAIIGDAAHGMYPFLGQGASAGFGDAAALASLMDDHRDDWGTAFSLYEKNRKVHMDALAELSKGGLILYRRHKKAVYQLVQEKFEKILHSLFPSWVHAPIHDMIARDPGKTADYLKQRAKLRTVSRYTGMSLAIAMVTAVIALQEAVAERLKKRHLA